MKQKVNKADWKMDIPIFVMTVLDRLQGSGYPAYIVGGAVRDSCLNRPVTDWDVTTSAPPEKIRSIFRGIRHFSLKYDTVTLVDSGNHYEVTTFRGAEGHGENIEEDLGHRDFTINAMAYDRERKEILDPHGGRGDLTRRLVRAVGDPINRFQEDPLRLLRAVRLATELRFKIESVTLKTISGMCDRLAPVASERIRDELMKILLSPKPSTGFNLMARKGILKQFIPELLEGYLKRQNSHHRYTIYKHVMKTVDAVEPEPVLRLTALFHDIAKPRVREKIDGRWRFLGHEETSARLAQEIMERLRFSDSKIGSVTHLIEHHMTGYDSNWSDAAVRRFVRRVGLEKIDPLVKFRRADLLAHGFKSNQEELLSELENRIEAICTKGFATETRQLAIDGHRVMDILGLSRGPEVGKILNELMERVTDHPELNTEKGLVHILKDMKRRERGSIVAKIA